MWDGAFSPRIQKSIGSVRFLPLADMTAADWAWLDYDNIRTVARNRIAASIAAGKLKGFFDVNITEKAITRSKPRYLWPGEQDDIDAFASGEKQPEDFLRNQKEVETDSTPADTIEGLRSEITFWPAETKATVFRSYLRYLLRIIRLADYAEDRKELQDEIDQLNKITNAQISSLQPGDAALLFVAVMAWRFPLSRIAAFVADVGIEAEEASVETQANAWFDGQVPAQQVAAGRGLTGGGRL